MILNLISVSFRLLFRLIWGVDFHQHNGNEWYLVCYRAFKMIFRKFNRNITFQNQCVIVTLDYPHLQIKLSADWIHEHLVQPALGFSAVMPQRYIEHQNIWVQVLSCFATNHLFLHCGHISTSEDLFPHPRKEVCEAVSSLQSLLLLVLIVVWK